MNARRPEPRPHPTYTHWPAACAPSRAVASALPGPARYATADAGRDQNAEAAPLQEEDPAVSGLDEPGYGHGV